MPARISPIKRHESGRQHCASVVNWWLTRSGFSHSQLTAVADWGVGHSGWLLSSQISHLRNGNIRSPGLQVFEALGGANEAVHCWETSGKEAALQRFGPSSEGVRIEEAMEGAIWLPHPDDPSSPLMFADWCELFVGLLTLPFVDQVGVSPADARHMSDALGYLLDQGLKQAGKGLRDGLAHLIELYPATGVDQATRLRGVALGARHLSARELEEDMPALATLLARLRGVPEENFGARELHAELTGLRYRS